MVYEFHIGDTLKYSILFLIWSITCTYSASFDCEKAKTFVEKTICSNSNLTALDSEMALLYAKVCSYSLDVKDSQNRWIKYRNSLRNSDSLITLYHERIEILKQMTYESKDGVSWSYREIDETNGLFPVLVNTPDTNVTKKVNQFLIHYSKNFGCEKEEYPHHKFNRVTSQARLVGHFVFSIEIKHTYDCGGAYPTVDERQSLSFDLRTGNLIDVGSAFDYSEKNKLDMAEYFYNEFVKSESLYPELIESSDCMNALSVETFLHYDNYDIFFTEDGLEFKPYFPHILANCSNSVLVPYSRLKQWLKPNSIVELIYEDKELK